MNIEDLSVEEICERINIQSNLLALQGDDEEKIRSALGTLATITRLTSRRDGLYVLIGYYSLEVRGLDEIEAFFRATESARSCDLTYIILRDLAKEKESYRRRLLMTDLMRHLRGIGIDATDQWKKACASVVASSQWGEKQKAKFLDALKFGERL
jgi:hypothetical protein